MQDFHIIHHAVVFSLKNYLRTSEFFWNGNRKLSFFDMFMFALVSISKLRSQAWLCYIYLSIYREIFAAFLQERLNYFT